MAGSKAEKTDSSEHQTVTMVTARRTVTETDIVTFVNVVGLHEPPFIDIEYIQSSMPESHQKRFAPAPFLISVGMGLMAPHIMGVLDQISEKYKLGLFMGMVGIEGRVKAPGYPGDTLQVELEARVKRKTSKGMILVDLRHILTKQTGAVVVDFVETVMFGPPAE